MRAATIASYAFTGGSVNADTTAANITASSFTENFSGTAGFSSSSNMAFVRSDATPDNLAEAITNGAYFQFTVTVAPGFQLSLTSLNFDHLANTSAVYTSNVSSFINDYASDTDALNTSSGTVGSTGSTPALIDNVSISLSGGSFDNLTGTQTIRFYVFDSLNSSTPFSRIDSVSLEGSVSVIPEPSTFMLFGLAGVAALAGLRRRRMRVCGIVNCRA